MNDSVYLILFRIDDHKFAMSVSEVERVARAAMIKELPLAPEIIMGILNYGGSIIPVVNARKRFNIPERPLRLTDRFIIAHDQERGMALVCDEAFPARKIPAERITKSDRIIPGIGFVDAVVDLEGSMIYLLSVDLILTHDERHDLDAAIMSAGQEQEDD
jgi:purine-binding chemotaxis protein CheW